MRNRRNREEGEEICEFAYEFDDAYQYEHDR